jgi:MFS family permease
MSTEPLLQHKVPIIAIACACIIALLAFGPRSAMGFFQLPMLQDNGWDRATFGMAMALQNLFWGMGQPLFGVIADKFGAEPGLVTHRRRDSDRSRCGGLLLRRGAGFDCAPGQP